MDCVAGTRPANNKRKCINEPAKATDGLTGHCIGGNLNIPIWTWSVSLSVQIGRLKKSRTQSAYCVVNIYRILSNPMTNSYFGLIF